jgi:hypothetical protein
MKNLLLLCLMLVLGVATKAQVCNNGPFPGHNFGFSVPFTLPNGNMGVRVVYRNTTIPPGSFIQMQGLSFTVRTNGCGSCTQIQRAWSTIFYGAPNLTATVTLAPDGRSATFGWNGVPTGSMVEIFHDDPIMILDLGSWTCGNATCFDLSISNMFMFANGAPVPQNQIGLCDREICKAGFGISNCPDYGAGSLFMPSPYSQPTLSAGDDFASKNGSRFSRIQFWSPINDATPVCIEGISFTVAVSGDLQIIGATSTTFPNATITFTGDRATLFYFGAGQPILNSDVFMLLQFANNGGCGTISICDIFVRTCNGEINPLTTLATCPKRVCIGPNKMGEEAMAAAEGDALGVIAFPNPFTNETEVRFDLATAGAAHFKVFSTSGQLIFQASQMGMEGNNSFKFAPTQEIAAGIYYYTLETSQGVSRGKLVRQ